MGLASMTRGSITTAERLEFLQEIAFAKPICGDCQADTVRHGKKPALGRLRLKPVLDNADDECLRFHARGRDLLKRGTESIWYRNGSHWGKGSLETVRSRGPTCASLTGSGLGSHLNIRHFGTLGSAAGRWSRGRRSPEGLRYDITGIDIFYQTKTFRAMNVSLTPELEKAVKAKVASGLYGNASEVVREALRESLLREREAQWIAREVGIGYAQLEAGQVHRVGSKKDFKALVRGRG